MTERTSNCALRKKCGRSRGLQEKSGSPSDATSIRRVGHYRGSPRGPSPPVSKGNASERVVCNLFHNPDHVDDGSM